VTRVSMPIGHKRSVSGLQWRHSAPARSAALRGSIWLRACGLDDGQSTLVTGSRSLEIGDGYGPKRQQSAAAPRARAVAPRIPLWQWPTTTEAQSTRLPVSGSGRTDQINYISLPTVRAAPGMCHLSALIVARPAATTRDGCDRRGRHIRAARDQPEWWRTSESLIVHRPWQPPCRCR